MKATFHHMSDFIRFMVKRDRFRIPIWLFAITIFTVLTASSFSGLYQTEEERQAIAETMLNPAMTAMVGPGYGLDDYTEGAMLAHQMLLFSAVIVAIMSILLVARHTRSDEEEGRMELLRALPIGRLSITGATLTIYIFVHFLLAILMAIGLTALQIDHINWTGSLLYGVSLGVVGIFFVALTSVFAQITESTRGTIGLSFATLFFLYIIRAIGDVSIEWLSWLSPLNWILRTEVYVNNYWWPVLLLFIVSLFLIILSLYLNFIRDLGSGFLPTRKGSAHANSYLRNPLALSFRLQRTSIIIWAIGMFVIGLSYGSIFGDLESFIASNEMFAEMLTASDISLTEQFITMLMTVMSMIATVPALMIILKLRGEEKRNMTEGLFAYPISRINMIASYTILSVICSIVMLLLACVGLWLAQYFVMEEPLRLGILLPAIFVYMPAILVMVAISIFFIGVIPKMSSMIWCYLGYSFFVVYLGDLLQFPTWLNSLSPFGAVPNLPVEDMNWAVTFILCLIAIVLTTVGFTQYRSRDLEG
ncbi:ABC transporter permease [Halalkalibacter sp. AB-rgal2]|uniref:ABC transporter permease n=1 Tax=Halalkalibacter sp. AB-rgal2 TaxID=3242695 RepID=UPI00359DA7F2